MRVAPIRSYLNVCSTVDGTVRERLGRVASLEVCHWVGLEISKAHAILG